MIDYESRELLTDFRLFPNEIFCSQWRELHLSVRALFWAAMKKADQEYIHQMIYYREIESSDLPTPADDSRVRPMLPVLDWYDL